jgi:hypothetical protein
MPLQNRIMPDGSIVSDSARGTFMGNRGVLHNSRQQLLRQFRLKAWITCQLQFKGRKRQLMSPGMYTELFFLDEVTAFSAGHRPCAECRRDRFNEFKQVWIIAHGEPSNGKLKVADIDNILHQERTDTDGSRPTWTSRLGDLPIGAVFLHENDYLCVHPEGLRRWTIEGYQPVTSLPSDLAVSVITPKSIVSVFKAGLLPDFHHSAG